MLLSHKNNIWTGLVLLWSKLRFAHERYAHWLSIHKHTGDYWLLSQCNTHAQILSPVCSCCLKPWSVQMEIYSLTSAAWRLLSYRHIFLTSFHPFLRFRLLFLPSSNWPNSLQICFILVHKTLCHNKKYYLRDC